MIANDQDLHEALETIASNWIPSFVTLDEQHSDGLDFHTVHVSSLEEMLKEAFDLGFKHRDEGGFN